jgi:ubiquinone/menaquinone biosynthesis C-methylase UbiE
MMPANQTNAIAAITVRAPEPGRVEEKQQQLETALAAAIDPWLEHMRWRRDFEKWRAGRLWQEKKQASTVNHLREFLCATVNADNASRAEVLAGKSILDLGCGMGGLSTALALAGARVQSLDFNSDYCRITQLRGQRYGLALSPVNGAGEALPFRDARFDVIVCLDVLEHVRAPEKLLAEIGRCLKPGGLCHITAINRFAFRDPHYHVRFVNWLPRPMSNSYLRIIGRVKDNSRFSDQQTLADMHYYRYGQLRKLFVRSGLSEPADVTELKLTGNPSGWKGMLQRVGLLRAVYRAYRSLFKTTYTLMATRAA